MTMACSNIFFHTSEKIFSWRMKQRRAKTYFPSSHTHTWGIHAITLNLHYSISIEAYIDITQLCRSSLHNMGAIISDTFFISLVSSNFDFLGHVLVKSLVFFNVCSNLNFLLFISPMICTVKDHASMVADSQDTITHIQTSLWVSGCLSNKMNKIIDKTYISKHKKMNRITF